MSVSIVNHEARMNETSLPMVQHAQPGLGRDRYLTQDEPLDSPGLIPAHLKRSARAHYPLLEILQRLVYRLQPGTTLNSVLALVALYNASAPIYGYLKKFLASVLTSQITISEYDPVAREVMAYMSATILPQSVWNTKAILTSGSLSQESNGYMQEMMLARYGHALPTTDEVQLMPPVGNKIFWVGFRPYLFSRKALLQPPSNPIMHRYSEGAHQGRSSIVITTIGWSLKPLEGFVKACHEYKVKNSGATTTVYFSGGGSPGDYGSYAGGQWRSVIKAIRKMDTIDIDSKVKNDLISDAEQYYSTESKKFYADCGIPYRRGYLFYGPPGTGKTSFSAALAGHLKCDLYMINLASGDISDGKLHSLFLSLPKKCVVVIEDIDSAGIGREQESDKAVPSFTQLPLGEIPLPPPPSRSRRRNNPVTLSGLLNAIDGNASQEGRLLIMTSNDPDALDEALVRPGRVDKKIPFGNMSEATARGIFERLIGRAAISFGAYTQAQIAEKAVQFAGSFPVDRFTPAQVQSFLQECRGDADKAVAGISRWAAETLKSDEEKKLKEKIQKQMLNAKKKKAKSSELKANSVDPSPTSKDMAAFLNMDDAVNGATESSDATGDEVEKEELDANEAVDNDSRDIDDDPEDIVFDEEALGEVMLRVMEIQTRAMGHMD